ncbi:protein enabled homolog [Panicum virgatum]|uniref:Uncharacterized protein n=1 Tax=Panicum virgatum TaxID=38727 RepID=A0A8T0Y1R4_PANVG|nr:protein enabled homolog [Panicum virgatum]KAG2661339.1 hypothetical protein PVAP13_1KG499900 [Panicum virgatum]
MLPPYYSNSVRPSPPSARDVSALRPSSGARSVVPSTAQCPTVPRSRGHASLPSTSPRHASRQFHLAAALTLPPPALSLAHALHASAAAARPPEADSPPPPRDTPPPPPPLLTNRRPIHQLRRATRRRRRPYSGQITEQLRSRPPPAGFRPNLALSAIGSGCCEVDKDPSKGWHLGFQDNGQECSTSAIMFCLSSLMLFHKSNKIKLCSVVPLHICNS